ncbi:MAG TPA: ABC transporter substrate-binding protein [Rhizomicrobium sp.]|nr:ABC transporter substrate-binding protein [Rhizomicrobium sp.]
MRRREFITLLGGATAWPLSARAQQSDRIRRVSVLIGLAEDDPDAKTRLGALRQGLEKLGWSEGRNIHLEVRFALPSNEQQVQTSVKELLAASPDVVVAQTTAISAAFRRESRTIPIVFVAVGDPIGAGFIANLARPRSNLTGLTLYDGSVAGKWLAMLKEIDPRVTRATFVINPKTSSFPLLVHETETMAKSLGIELTLSTIENAGDIARVIESFASLPNGGLVFPPNATTTANRDLIVALAARYSLPAVYAWREFVAAGGLLSYGTDFVDLYRQTASYVDRILHGSSPAEIPVQAPTRYQTVLNLKTAKALDLTVPTSLLLAADEVIQ